MTNTPQTYDQVVSNNNIDEFNLNTFIQEHYRRYYEVLKDKDEDYWFFIMFIDKRQNDVKTMPVHLKKFFENENYRNMALDKIYINKDKYNIYYSVFVFTNKRRIEENVLPIASGFVFDIDKDEHEEMTEEEIEQVLKTIEELEEQGFGSWTIISSGRGIQLKIDFIDVIEFEDKDKLKEEYIKWAKVLDTIVYNINQSLSVDYNALKLTQIMRLPYTVNQSNKQEAKILKVGRRIDYFSIRDMIDDLYTKIEKYDKEEKNVEGTRYITKTEQIENLKHELALTLKPYWRKGLRHFLSLSVAGFLYKFTDLTEEEVKDIIKYIAEENGDEEINDRVKSVETTFKKNKEDVAYLSFLVNVMTDEEIEEYKKSLHTVISRYSKRINNVRYMGLLRKTIRTKTFVVQNNKDIREITFKEDDEGNISIVEEEVLVKATLKLLNVKNIVNKNNIKRVYTVIINTEDRKFTLKDVSLDELSKSLFKMGLAGKRSDALATRLSYLLLAMIKKDNIQIETIYSDIEISYENSMYVLNNLNDLKVLKENNIDLNTIDIDKVYEILKNINDYTVMGILLSHVFQTFFVKTDKLLRPLLLLLGDKGLGKTTLARFFTSTAFVSEIATQDTLESIFRITDMLTKTTTVLFDDVNYLNSFAKNIIKSYVTDSNLKIKRGRSNLDVEEFELNATILMTANSFKFTEDALRDRFILLQIDEYTFKDTEHAFMSEEDWFSGWGYIILQKIIEYLNENHIRIRDLVREEVQRYKNVSYRRARIYAQLSAMLRVLYNVIEDEELSSQLKKLYDEFEEVVEVLEVQMYTSDDYEDAFTIIQMILHDDEISKYVITEEFSRGSENWERIYITSAALTLIKKKLKINISKNELAKILNGEVKSKRTPFSKYPEKVIVLEIKTSEIDKLGDEDDTELELIDLE